jgi:hypothetical protein
VTHPTVRLLALAGALFAATGCVDPKSRLNDFENSVVDASVDMTPDAPPLNELPDVTGYWFVGVAPTVAPTSIVYFYWDVTLTKNPDGTGTMNVAQTAISTDANGRMHVGDTTMMNDVHVSTAGEFSLGLTGINIPGSANPLTGSDLVASFTNDGIIKSKDLMCGTLAPGSVVTSPVQLDVSGSTWAAIRVTKDAAGNDLPPAQFECPADLPDAGPTTDAAPTDASNPDA